MSPSTAVTQSTYTVHGMTCGHCVSSITTEVSKLPGVSQVEITLEDGVMTISSDAPLDRTSVAAAVTEAGYELGSAPDAEPPAASCCGSCH